MQSYFLFFALLLLGACSQGGQHSPVAFKLALGSLSTPIGAAGEGGFVIYGKAASGAAFGRVITTTDAVTISLPNDTWTFYALAWKGDGDGNFDAELDVMRGDVQCAHTAPTVLNGTTVNVPLALSNTTCDTAAFTGPVSMAGSGTKTFRSPQLKSCKDLSSVSSGSDVCVYDTAGGVYTRGYGSGLRFKLRSFNMGPGGQISWQGAALAGGCQGDNGSDIAGLFSENSSGTSYNLPHLTEFPMGLSAEVFFGVTQTAPCDPDYGSNDIAMLFGTQAFATANGVATVKAFETGGGSTLHTFLRIDEAMACDTSKADPNAVAGGYGTQNAPYLICHKDNLRAAQGAAYTAATSTGHFILLRNINYWAGLDPNSNSGPPVVEPIGSDVGANVAEPYPFDGTFNGNGKRIVGLRIEVPPNPYISQDIGFFRAVGPNGRVFDLELDAFEIRKDYSKRVDRVGGVVGRNLGVLENVRAVHGRLEGSVDVGGAVGLNEGANASLVSVTVRQGRIEGRRNVGGLVGNLRSSGDRVHVTKSGVYDTAVEGDTFKQDRCVDYSVLSIGLCPGGPSYVRDGFCESNVNEATEAACVTNGKQWGQPYAFGGLAGNMAESAGDCSGGAVHIDQSMAEAHIVAYAGVGGLVGVSAGNCELRNSYSTSSVTALTDDTVTGYKKRAGGLVGKVGSATGLRLNRVFHVKGAIQDNATNEESPLIGLSTASMDCSQAYVDAGANPSYCSMPAQFQLETNLYTAATFTGWDFATTWDNVDDGFTNPQLRWEDPHACDGKRNGTFGAGTLAQPITVCTLAQFLALDGAAPTNHYRLLDTINLRLRPTPGTIGYAVNQFSGNLDGNWKPLSNHSAQTTNGGVFNTIQPTARLKRILVVGSKIATTATRAGLLAATNNGSIDRAYTFGSVLSRDSVGGVVAVNNGSIVRTVSNAVVGIATTAGADFGGIAGDNNGIIALSRSRAKMVFNGSVVASRVGGIAGSNLRSAGGPVTTATISPTESITGKGYILETLFEGSMHFSGTAAHLNIGGIVGSNYPNAEVTDTHAEFRLSDVSGTAPNSALGAIGGLVGYSWSSSFLGSSLVRLDLKGPNTVRTAACFSAPAGGSQNNLRYLTSGTWPGFSNCSNSDSLEVFQSMGTNGSPAGALYYNNLASFPWNIGVDWDGATPWVYDFNSGPRLRREGDDDEDVFELFQLYGSVTP